MRHVWIVLLALSLSTVVYGQKSAAVRQLEQQRKEALADIEETNKLLQETAQNFPEPFESTLQTNSFP